MQLHKSYNKEAGKPFDDKTCEIPVQIIREMKGWGTYEYTCHTKRQISKTIKSYALVPCV